MQPFNTLAKSLNLPQTATLSLQGLSRLPLIEEDAFQWWHSFDEGGERKQSRLYSLLHLSLYPNMAKSAVIQHPNPTASISTIKVLIDHLTSTTPGDPAWHPSNLHLFGFAQGGQAAAELSLAFSTSTESSFGSLVTILAPLISFPTSRKKSMTPTLILFRKGDERSVSLSLASYRKGFEKVTEVILARPGGMMLRGREEWQVIMKYVTTRYALLFSSRLIILSPGYFRFWSERLQKRSALEFGKDVFEIRGGIGAVPKS